MQYVSSVWHNEFGNHIHQANKQNPEFYDITAPRPITKASKRLALASHVAFYN
jgi:hypothetical protein